MLNFVFSPNILLGFILGSSVIILYFLRLVKPEVARDEDIFFATIGLLYSCILMVHGWRLDPILLFSQVLIIVTALVTGWENIRLRGLIANMAKLKKKKKCSSPLFVRVFSNYLFVVFEVLKKWLGEKNSFGLNEKYHNEFDMETGRV